MKSACGTINKGFHKESTTGIFLTIGDMQKGTRHRLDVYARGMIGYAQN